MQNYKESGYIENRKPVDKEYNNILGTPINEKYSALIYAKIKELEKIHQGGHFSTGIFSIEIEGEGGTKRIYAVKKVRFSESSVEYIKKFQAVKESGLPTFDEAFILSGDYPGRRSEDARKGKVYFVSTLLNNENNVILAINVIGRNFPLNTEDRNYEEIFRNKLKIKNFQKLVKEILHKLIKAYEEYGVLIGHDSIFFSVPVDHKQEEVEIGWLVGDFDCVGYDIERNFFSLVRVVSSFDTTMREFVESYCAFDKVGEYKRILRGKIGMISSKLKLK